ncbi:MAG: ATP-binding protein [Leptolyngbya sp. SIO4C1]|nr:ATP-binding protein [Leptolyngbya sp. SIO4C1]
MRFDLNLRSQVRQQLQTLASEMKTWQAQAEISQAELEKIRKAIGFFEHTPQRTKLTVAGVDGSGDFPSLSYADTFIYLTVAQGVMYAADRITGLREVAPALEPTIRVSWLPMNRAVAHQALEETLAELAKQPLLAVIEQSDYGQLKAQETGKTISSAELLKHLIRPDASDTSNLAIQLRSTAELGTALRLLARDDVPDYLLVDTTLRHLTEEGLERQVVLSRADVVPEDLSSISEFSEQQIAFATQQFAQWGEHWIGRVLMGDTQGPGGFEAGPDFLPGTVAAVQRRLGFLRRGHTRLFSPFDPDLGDEYRSLLPDILCALEQGRVLIVDTTLMGELEQFLLTTVVARSLFTLRRALRSVESVVDLPEALRQAFGNEDGQGQVGLRTLANELVARVEKGQLPYVDGERLRPTDELPYVNVVVEEAPSVLNPQRMRFGSVFRDISRQGRKFGIGLTVVSQQVSEIDDGVLTQLNTELVVALGNEAERKAAIRNGSADLSGFERELQVMGKGQVVVAASYKDVPLPVQVPEFDRLES